MVRAYSRKEYIRKPQIQNCSIWHGKLNRWIPVAVSLSVKDHQNYHNALEAAELLLTD